MGKAQGSEPSRCHLTLSPQVLIVSLHLHDVRHVWHPDHKPEPLLIVDRLELVSLMPLDVIQLSGCLCVNARLGECALLIDCITLLLLGHIYHFVICPFYVV